MLKGTNVALGFTKDAHNIPGPENSKFSGKELGERAKMYTFVQQRGFQSNVLPLTSNNVRTGAPVDNKSTN